MEKYDLDLDMEKSEGSRKSGRSKKQKDCLIYLLTGQQFRCEVAVSCVFACYVNTGIVLLFVQTIEITVGTSDMLLAVCDYSARDILGVSVAQI